MSDIEELRLKLTVDNSGLSQGMTKATAIVETSCKGMRTALADVAKQAQALLPALSVVALAAFTRGAISSADHINDLALRTGFAGSTLSSLNIKLLQTGTNLDDFSGSVNRMNNLIGEAAKGINKDAIKSFDDLGLSVQKLVKISPEEQFFTIAKALGSVSNQATFTNSGMAIFGRSFSNLAPIIKETQGNLRQFSDEQKKLGNALTDDQLKKIDEFGDKWTEMVEKMKISILNSGILTYLGHLSDGINAIVNLPDSAFRAGGDLARATGLATNPNVSTTRPATVDHATFLPSASGSNAKLLNAPTAQELKSATEAFKQYNLELNNQHLMATMAPRDAAAQKAYFDTLQKAQKAGIKDAEGLADANAAVARSTYDMNQKQEEATRFAAELKDQFAATAKSIVFDSKNAADALTKLGQALAEMIVQRQILGPLSDSLFGLPGAGAGAGLLGGLFSSQGSAARLFETGNSNFVGPLPSFDVGTNYVPRDMTAKIHQGEGILTKEENARRRANGGTPSITVNQTNNFQSGVTRQEVAGMLPVLIDASKNAVAEEIERGGNLARIVGRRS